jgi:hypothetical protein
VRQRAEPAFSAFGTEPTRSVTFFPSPQQDRFLPAISRKLAFFAGPFDNLIEFADMMAGSVDRRRGSKDG